jgi:L-fuconolactonase
VAQWAAQRLIDTHVHILQPSRWHYHWLQEDSPLHRDYLLSDIENDLRYADVHSALFIEATNNSDEISWLLEFSAKSDLQTGVIGWINPDDPNAATLIANFATNPSFKGIRINWLREDINTASLASLLKQIALHKLVVDVLTRADYLPLLAEVVADYPSISFVLDHIGGIDLHQPEKWHAQLEVAARLPNVIGKISGYSHLEPSLMKVALRELIAVTHALFGSERLFFGSNMPFGRDRLSYIEIVNVFIDALQQLPEESQSEICYQTAARVYRMGES